MTLPAPADMLDLTGKVVVVTGAGGGIGFGIARRLSLGGASIVAHTRNTPVATDALAGRATVVTADLTSTEGPPKIIDTALNAFGRLDALVNNAGVQDVAGLSAMPDDTFRSMLEVNVTATHRLTRAFATHVVESGTTGSVVHIASIEGHNPAAGHAHYATAKAAILMHTRAAALEYGPHGIRVNSVSPGLIERPGIDTEWPDGVERWKAAAPLGRLGTREDIGDACLFLLSDLARWITGADLVVDGGMLARPTW